VKNKFRNRIRVSQAVELFRAFGFSVRIPNSYTFLIYPEESEYHWDWYHTTGTVMSGKDKYSMTRSPIVIKDPEMLANHIFKEVYG
jgi:hypothetical protein